MNVNENVLMTVYGICVDCEAEFVDINTDNSILNDVQMITNTNMYNVVE